MRKSNIEDYVGVKFRCYDRKHPSYVDYGARGITIDFKAFYDWCILNGYEKGLQIDRRNNNGNYEPSNCRWVTIKVNANNKRNNRYIEYNGITKHLHDWASDLNKLPETLSMRITRGWNIDKAFNKPLRFKKNA